MKRTFKGYAEIKGNELIACSTSLKSWLGTQANPVGKIYKCDIVIHTKEKKEKQ